MFFKWRIEIPKELSGLFDLYKKEIKYYTENENIDDSKNEIKYCDRKDLDDFEEYKIIENLKSITLTETFQELLFKYIDRSGLSDSQIYRKAFIDRRLFSKIRTDKHYHPSFGTVTLLALALKLNTEEYEKLLDSASYSLGNNMFSRITLRYCFDNKIYNVVKVNNLVYSVTGKEIKDL